MPLIAALLTLVAGTAAAQSAYGVYCRNGQIVVDARALDQMGSGSCQFGGFATRSDAENFAGRNFGGERTRCSCR
jgi:hypothetical protein